MKEERDFENFYNNEKRYSWSFQTLKGYYRPLDLRRLDLILAEIQDLPKQMGEVLDLGCGAGLMVKAITRKGYKVTGCDISKTLLERVDKEGLDFKLVYANAAKKLPFKDNSFDLVTCSEVLEHIPANEITIREIERVLKKNGMVIITVPNLFCYDSLEGRFRLMTKIINLINLFRKKPLFQNGFSTHVHKHDQKQWMGLIETGDLKVRRTKAIFISPYVFEFTGLLKKLEVAWYKNRIIYYSHLWIEKKIGAIWPFRSLGQGFMIIAENNKSSPKY